MNFSCEKLETKIKFKIKKSAQIIALGIICFLVIFPLASVQARVFEPENIFTDQELLDKDSLSKTAIQKFLERKNSVLARYSQVVDGKAMTAAEMIYSIAQLHNISSKFLLATLEKEQGLIHKTHATEKELDWATGYGCYGGQCNSKYQGFYDQVESSAITQNIYFDRASTFAFQVGKMTVTFDGYSLVPQNQATANLFIYTPYVGYSPELGVTKPYGGNRLFWNIWNRYFTKQYYPEGFVLKNSGNYYLIEKNKKRRFKNMDIFLADYDEADAQSVTNDVLSAYENGSDIEFSKNTLVKHPTTGQIYLLADHDIKRPLLDNSALALLSDVRIAVTESQIPTVSLNQLANYKEGETISSTSIYPQGKLFRTETGEIYLLKDSIKYLVDPVVWEYKYNSQTPQSINSGALADYFESGMDRLPDGTFVTNSGKYYIIAVGGERMRVQTTAILSRVFGSDKLTSAIAVSDDLLAAHAAGYTIDYIDDTIKDPIVPTTTTTSTAPSGSYTAQFIEIDPASIIMINGEAKTLKLAFKNTGSSVWTPETVYLKVLDKGTNQSSFAEGKKFPLSESLITNNNVGTFNAKITAPNVAGLQQVDFTLFSNKNGVETPITNGSIGRFISVKSGQTAQVVSHNFPIAVLNTWGPQDITVKIKNTSDTTWDAKYTKLKIYDENGLQSQFYDPNDWLDETVAAIPIRTKTVEAGETAEFKFTLKPTKLEPKVYTHKIVLELTDQEKTVFLDSKAAWYRAMRVD